MNNQRAFPRFPLTLDVSVILPGQGAQLCRVRDYCPGGMFLQCDPSFKAADNVALSIEFNNPEREGERLQLQGRVARTVANGVGIAFTAPNQVAMMTLAHMAQTQAAQQEQVGGTVSGDIPSTAARCKEVGIEGVRRLVARFFKLANDSMYDAADFLSDQMEQANFVAAMNELSRAKLPLSGEIAAELERRFDILDKAGYVPPVGLSDDAGQGGGLSLVDEQTFDNWLMVRSLASKVEEELDECLAALEARLAAIAQNRLDKENNPVGPLVVAAVFSQALQSLKLEDIAKKAVFLVMESVLNSELKQLYLELNTLLIEQGVLPELKQGMEVVKAPGSDRPQPQPTPVDTDEPSDELAQPPQSAAQGAAPTANNQAPAQISYRRVTGAASEAMQPAAPVLPYQGMQELMHLHGSGADTTPTAANGYFDSGQVMQALSQLEGQLAQAQRDKLEADGHVQFLVDTLSSLTGEEGKGLSDEVRDTVAYVGGLFNAMHRDRHLPETARPWLEAVEVPLLKAGIADPSMMEDAEHPGRQLVNRLEQVGRYVEGDKGEGRTQANQQVDNLLDEVKKRVEKDPDVFAEVLGKLDEIRDVYRGVYRNNIQKIISECERESALNRQRDAVLGDLNTVMGKREVPSVVLSMLESGLKNCLFRTHVKSGADSDAYKSYLNFVDQLSARLAGRQPVRSRKQVDDATLLQWLPRVLASASKDEAMNETLRAEIEGYLKGEAKPKLQFVPHLAVKSAHLDENASKPKEVDSDVWQLLLSDARSIDDGEAFVYDDKEHGTQQEVKLVWRNEEDRPPRYVFADNSGEKSLDLSLGEVASLLYHSVLARMEMRDLSATERATYDFLQNIHNNLSFQAQHDELTGLLNRKAFERGLETAYNEVIATQSSGVLGYIDLDRFNIINTTCGHAEGDKLLQEVAEIFKELAGDAASVARLGGDEFGIILEGTGRVEGLRRITALHDAIREVRFGCEDNEFKITASVGMAEINERSESSSRLLSAVDAACFTAKDQGRDNIQIHNPENSRINSRNNILEWVGRINVLFDKNLIQLRCQKIDPLQKTVNSLPHYEVLLDVHDEQGNKVPTEDFIVAAERYNRITDIDTWVVNYLIDWLEKHRDKLHRISGVSINLSGNSIGNRRFMEHIQQRLSVEGFPADKVIFEVTETIAINNLDNAARFMRMLKDVGCRFSLDDFGSGTSSYSYLRTLPIDYLKIDGAFVTDIAKNPSDYAVVKSINEIGHVMGLKTVAEYVEDEFALQALKAIGLDYVQGFGVEKPIPLFKLFG